MGFWTSEMSASAAEPTGRSSLPDASQSAMAGQSAQRAGLPLLRDCRPDELVAWLQAHGSNQEFVLKVQERKFDGETMWQYLKRTQTTPFWARLAISNARWNDLQDSAILDNAVHKQRQKEDMRYIKETLSFIRKMMDQYR